MKKRKTLLRAIDVYSGVGGWSLGLRMAGINVVASYELWEPANETNFKNNHHRPRRVDLRKLDVSELPRNVDIVVGSPPCTQFSFSNRGGSGDIRDGLEDIVTFLNIVDHVKPKVWAMENVPRVAKILEKELRPKGRLAHFAHLNIVPHVINMEKFGLPQRRRRCIAGNLDFELLLSYANVATTRTLGDVVRALAKRAIRDPIFGTKVARAALRDHIAEEHLDVEEERINRAAKTTHPVYNAMPFPDSLKRSARTITATCTRVSRESIIIKDPINSKLRRLTIRERACVQGFPLKFQFYGSNYSQKLRLVGNALPPVFAYYVAQAALDVPAKKIRSLASAFRAFEGPSSVPVETPPPSAGKKFPPNRTFKFAIPSLMLKSGVRFELRNSIKANRVRWEVAFIFGTPKSIQRFPLDASLSSKLLAGMPKAISTKIGRELDQLTQFIRHADIPHMQTVWCHKGPGGIRPLMMLDRLEESGQALTGLLGRHASAARRVTSEAIVAEYGSKLEALSGRTKLTKNPSCILAGMLVGSVANAAFQAHTDAKAVQLPRRCSNRQPLVLVAH